MSGSVSGQTGSRCDELGGETHLGQLELMAVDMEARIAGYCAELDEWMVLRIR